MDHVEWTEGEAAHDKVYVYVAVGRVGIEVLEFDPSAAFASRLQFVERLETPAGMAGLRIRQEPDPSQRTLLVGESRAGLRTFVYED